MGKKAKKKILLFKVDFEKAFDSINWEYLDSILLQMGYGDKWRMWMKGCLVSGKASVLINGSPTKEFTMEKGRQAGRPSLPVPLYNSHGGSQHSLEDRM